VPCPRLDDAGDPGPRRLVAGEPTAFCLPALLVEIRPEEPEDKERHGQEKPGRPTAREE
jgi:hypothetical protein